MTFYMFLNTICTLYLSSQYITTIRTVSPIEMAISGANEKKELFKKVSKDGKTLILKAKDQALDSNMTVITTDGVFNFLIKTSKRPHKFVSLQYGRKSKNLVLKKETNYYSIFDGKTSQSIHAKGQILVNGEVLNKNEKRTLPKGCPVHVDGRRVFN